MVGFTYDDNLYSDLHKDAYGFRPSYFSSSLWSEMSPEAKQIEWDWLLKEMHARYETEVQEQKQATHDLELRIQNLLVSGAKDRNMAIRWLDEAYETQGDREYLCYKLNVPYEYLKETV
jgi:hypothetical protein